MKCTIAAYWVYAAYLLCMVGIVHARRQFRILHGKVPDKKDGAGGPGLVFRAEMQGGLLYRLIEDPGRKDNDYSMAGVEFDMLFFTRLTNRYATRIPGN
ncbi:hypothetical protein D4M92_27415 [Klebsiella michiganensis]|nr:hypothetical protein D4M92_27415 [Klebsiella michiganensis]